MVSCTREVLKQNGIDPWLNTISGAKTPEIDITGRWRDSQGTGLYTWGQGYLQQEHNKINGAIGDYTVVGIVSGRTVYLVFLDDEGVYYTARLEMAKDLLTGRYFNADDKDQKNGSPASFVRIYAPSKPYRPSEDGPAFRLTNSHKICTIRLII